MKKLMIMILLGLAIAFGAVQVSAETVTYDLTFYENYQYNLETGTYQAANGYAVTNRLVKYSDAVEVANGSLVPHFVLLWDVNNTYLGYYTMSSTYNGGTKYLGDFCASATSCTITFPAGVKLFAFMVDTLGVNRVPDGFTEDYKYIFNNPSWLDYQYEDFGGDTLSDVQTAYSITFLNYWTYRTDDDLLSLKNLIPNSDGTSITGWISNGESTLSTSDGFNVSTGNTTITLAGRGLDIIRLNAITPPSSGTNYYTYFQTKVDQLGFSSFRLRFIQNNTTTGSTDINFTVSNASQLYTFSTMYTSINTNAQTFNLTYIYPINTNITGYKAYFDNIITFASSTFTKSQLDSAIAYFGYFPYNETINVPDVTNGQWTSESFAYILENASDYNGTLTDLDIANTWNWFQIETAYSITLDNADKAYLWQLYEDAVNEIDRYEWYTQYGMTALNYQGMRDAFDNITTWYGSGIAFSVFDNTTVEYDRVAPTPPEELTFLESIEAYIDDLGVGDFGYFLISMVIMIAIAIVFGLLKAKAVIILIIEAALMVMFAIFGWFPIWLIIVLIIALMAFIFFAIKGNGGGGE
jgi:hypothetical protein